MDRIRIACVDYLNTAPLIAGLDVLEGVELIPTVPSRIAGMVAAGEADIGLASIVDAPRHGLTLLDAGMIGCDGPTLTVRLFSAVEPQQIQSVHIDTDSHTSELLCRVVLADQYAVQPEVVGFDARERIARPSTTKPGQPAPNLDEAWPEALLLIGDKVVSDCPPAVRYPTQIDLGAAWKELTGLPFMYAAWMCRKADAGDDRIAHAAMVLDRQRRRNLIRIEHLIPTWAKSHRWPRDLAARYLSEFLRFDITPAHRQAAGEFLTRAKALGLINEAELDWADFTMTSGV